MALPFLALATRPLTLCLLGFWCAHAVWAAEPASEHQSPADSNPAKLSSQSVLPLEELRAFTRTFDHIRQSYVQEIDDKTLLEYAIRGMLNELDPHSAYLDTQSFGDFQEMATGEFGGLGIEVSMEDGIVVVVSPIDDSPAQKAGIEAGDRIVKIDDTAVKGLDLGQAIEKMRGPKGSAIKLTIIREGADKPLEFTLKRDTIKVRSVRTERLEGDFGYLRIAQFQFNTGTEFQEALQKLQKAGDLNGLVLDLRNNPGGVLEASVTVADTFLDAGLVVYTEGRVANSSQRYHAEPGDLSAGLPLIVLINGGSASASEIVAGALQDHRRALLLGTRSFGKGSVQTVIPLNEDRALKLTTALYFTPNGRSIQAEGIQPDILIDRATITSLKPELRVREADLAGHLNQAKTSNATTKVTTKQRKEKKGTRIEDIQANDNQLYEAINLLKGLSLYRQSMLTVPQGATKAPKT